jgi:SAM-dependent methyltransferase
MSAHPKREWFDDDSFWIELYPFMFPERRFADAAEQTERLVKLTKPQGREVLDLCCGPGRLSIALAQKGFLVTGVDRTAFLLKKARARAKAAEVTIEWILADMRNFLRPAAFDLVISMFTSFGYFANPQDDLQVLCNIFTNLRPGGLCLIDVRGKERVARELQATTAEALPDGTLLVQRHEVVDAWTRVRSEWILIRKGRAKTFTFHVTLYSGQELRERLEGAGFRDVTLYGNLEGDEYGPRAERLIAAARKPAAVEPTTHRRTPASSRRPKDRG